MLPLVWIRHAKSEVRAVYPAQFVIRTRPEPAGQKKQELYNADYAVPIDSYFFSVAITSTSIIAPRGSAATWKQLRAG